MRNWLLAAAAAVVLLVALSACAPKAKDEAVQQTPPMSKEMGKMPATDAKPAAVAALPADANAKCPVAGDPVDPNVSVVYKGRTVYFCCKDCVAKFNKDPEKYMAKLDPPAAAPAAPAKTP